MSDDDALGYMNRRHKAPQSLEDDDEDSEEEEVEEVMALKGAADSDDVDDDEDEDEDDDDEDDDEDELTATGLKKLSDEEDSEEDDDEDEGVGALGFGGRKSDLYGGHEDEDEDDDEDLSDEDLETEKLEAAEALKLQRAHAARLRAEDFGDIDAMAGSGRGKKKGKAGRDAEDDATLSRQLDDELAELPYALRGAGGVRVEEVARDMSGLSEKEVAKALEADAPELLHLLGDFKETMREARSRVAPLVAAAKKRQLPPDGGLKLMQVKLQLMLSYATNIAFYLMLKAQGRAVREHPVIDALLKHRILLERIRPLEAKVSYRLTKLLQLAANSEGDGKLSTSQQDLAERPNPDALLNKGGGARSAAADDGEIDEDPDAGEEGDGLYRPPKMAAVPYEDEGGGSKKERQRERALARAASSRMVRELRSELSDAPKMIHADDFGASVDTDSVAVARFRKEEDERRKYEEDNFKRLSMTKDEKRAARRRKHAAEGVAVDELAAFDDFSHLYGVAKGSKEKAADPHEEKMRALKQYMNSIEQKSGANKGRKKGADDDAPQRNREDRAQKHAMRQARERDEAEDAGGGDEYGGGDDYGGGNGAGKRRGSKRPAPMPEEDPYYAEVAAQQKQRKQSKAERRAAEEAEAIEARRSAPTDTAEEGEARKAGRQIEKNRGLTRQRKKEDANPRVKNREKFRKAVIRRKGQVRTVAVVGDGPYAGEATGIKKNVSHSTRF